VKFPKEAKLVFKGIIFSVYQWRQQLFDGSFATFEGIKRTGTIQIIPTVGEKILLSYEEQPLKPRTYTFFGGRQETDEEPLDAAKRELLEETGMSSDDWDLYKSYQNRGNIDWDTYFFIARNCKKVSEPNLDPGERIAVKQVRFDEFLQITSRDNFWGLPHMIIDILRLRLDPTALEVFKKRLFGVDLSS
jgi:ADP-ribose pyrophosphatase